MSNQVSEKILLHKLQAKMLSSNKIAGFFNRQYLKKECINALEFLYDDIHLGKVTSEYYISVTPKLGKTLLSDLSESRGLICVSHFVLLT